MVRVWASVHSAYSNHELQSCQLFQVPCTVLFVQTIALTSMVALQELTQFVEEARQRMKDKKNKDLDEYDGLSPDAINALEEKKKKKN
jgi:hypothetical protein